MSFNLDARELPKAWPVGLREATETARGIRENPILKTVVEAMFIERSTKSTVGFNEHVAIEYIRKHLGDEGVERYRRIDFTQYAETVEELVNGPAAWRTSPLTVLLKTTGDLQQVYSPAPHVRLISDAIVDAVNGKGPRAVLVSLPPRYGKSETAGRRTLDWFLANYPGYPAMYVTATSELSTDMGRLVRNDVNLHSEVLGFSIAEDSSSAGRFHIDGIEGGQLIATGIFGQLSGRGAAICICDDILKSSEDYTPNQMTKIQSLWTSRFKLVCRVERFAWSLVHDTGNRTSTGFCSMEPLT
jgi:hypothetical protein